MRIDALRLDDFGCFLNARLDDLAEGLVVIGGPQRAGKTTFMRAIREFRSGVRRGADLPPPADEYRVDAEITHDGHRYRHVLNGYAEPTLSPLDGGPGIDVDDVFGPVTARQYRQLFTISLDELQRLPPGIDDAEDLARVLLGGAYGDIADIPEMQEEFADRAHDIGLTKGNPNAKTTELHDPYRTIRDGVDARREASEQVEEHERVTEELAELEDELADVETQIEEGRRERDRLSILDELFESVQRLGTLESRLVDADVEAAEAFPTGRADRLDHFASEFDAAVEELAEAERTFERNAELGSSGPYREWLLENGDELDRLERERHLLEDRVERLAEEERRLAERRQELESAIAELHSDWDGAFERVDAVETNAVDAAKVAERAAAVSDLHDERQSLESELDVDRSRVDDLSAELDEMGDAEDAETEVAFSKRKPAIVAASAVAAGTAAGAVATPIVGGLVGLFVLAVGLYAFEFTATVEPTVDTEPRQEVRAQIATLKSEISAEEDRLDEVSERLEAEEAALDELLDEIGLPDGVPRGSVARFYEQVVDRSEEVESYRRDRDTWDDDRAELADELRDVDDALEERSADSWSAEEPLENADRLLAELDAAADDLELARDVRDATTARTECVEDVDAVLSAWDEERSVDPSTDDETIRRRVEDFREEATRAAELLEAAEERNRLEDQVATRLDSPSAEEAFAPLRADHEPWIEVARSTAAEFADTGAIEDRIRNGKREIEALEGRREELREEIYELENRRDELASEDDLREAQAQIDEGETEFERVGEAYAVNRIAESMVSRLHERLMAEVVDTLVDDAGEIFSTVTQAYDGVELGGELQNLEFRALRSDGPDHGVGELSRATAEQLFLSVRLARIRQTEAPLPVVLDDAATNFDPEHVARVFQVMGELATTNQVFFLTCHPAFVDLTANSGASAQYWLLDDGVFTRTDDADVLRRRLVAD